jgi:hypothetical protein
MPNLILDGSKDLMKQLKAHEMNFKQTQDEAKLSPKPIPKNKRDKLRCNIGREGTYKNKAA